MSPLVLLICVFLSRKGQFLNVRGEKISEAVFYDALKSTLSKISAEIKLVDYCCVESVVLDEMDIYKGHLFHLLKVTYF